MKSLLEASYYKVTSKRVFTFKWRQGKKGKIVQKVWIKPENVKKHWKDLIDPPKKHPYRKQVLGKVAASGSLQPSKKKAKAAGGASGSSSAPASVARKTAAPKPTAAAAPAGAPAATGSASPPVKTVPASQRILVGPGPKKASLQRVLKAIESVHKMPKSLPVVGTIQKVPDPPVHGGYYHGQTPPYKPQAVLVNTESKYHAIAYAHEIGHVLDHHGLGKPGEFASASDPSMKAVMDTLDKSAAVQSLRRILETGLIPEEPYPGQYLTKFKIANAKFVGYLLEPHEIFARAYSQYIATKSKDPELLAQLAEWRKDGKKRPGKAYHPQQWSDDDFAPIAAAFDAMLAAKGLAP